MIDFETNSNALEPPRSAVAAVAVLSEPVVVAIDGGMLEEGVAVNVPRTTAGREATMGEAEVFPELVGPFARFASTRSICSEYAEAKCPRFLSSAY